MEKFFSVLIAILLIINIGFQAFYLFKMKEMIQNYDRNMTRMIQEFEDVWFQRFINLMKRSEKIEENLNKTIKRIEILNNTEKICSIRDDIKEAMRLHQYWLEHPQLYEQYGLGSPEWDKRWIKVYSTFLNATEFCD
ncbi:MAG: hypothetical protein ACTSXD_12405 [Candidatus Heimdallarchaeaceae archaeon]